jgi:hypothetical protein
VTLRSRERRLGNGNNESKKNGISKFHLPSTDQRRRATNTNLPGSPEEEEDDYDGPLVITLAELEKIRDKTRQKEFDTNGVIKNRVEERDISDRVNKNNTPTMPPAPQKQPTLDSKRIRITKSPSSPISSREISIHNKCRQPSIKNNEETTQLQDHNNGENKQNNGITAKEIQNRRNKNNSSRDNEILGIYKQNTKANKKEREYNELAYLLLQEYQKKLKSLGP